MEFHCRENAGQAYAFDEAFSHVDMAEELGLDGVWLAETHFTPARSVLSSPLIVASAIATRTARLRIGTAVLVLPLGNPLRIAEETATLDHLSAGRLDLGVGRSGLPGAYEGYNIPYSESRVRFFECLDVIFKAWTNERFSHKGEYFTFNDVCLTPKPVQFPCPRVRVAATSSDTFSEVGHLGLPIFIGLRSIGMSQVAEQVQLYKRAWADAGHKGPADLSLRVPVYVAETKEEALAEPEESFMRQFIRLGVQLATSADQSGIQSQKERSERGQSLRSLTWPQVVREKVVVGTPEMVVERLEEMKEVLSLSGVVAEFNAGEMIPRERVERSLRLFCEQVVPSFK